MSMINEMLISLQTRIATSRNRPCERSLMTYNSKMLLSESRFRLLCHPPPSKASSLASQASSSRGRILLRCSREGSNTGVAENAHLKND